MFDNIDKEIFWKLLPNTGVAERDTQTRQMMYDGRLRGETERFMLVLGKMFKDVFNDLGRLNEVNVNKLREDLLGPLAKTYYALFIKPEDTVKTRRTLEMFFHAWRLKGTEAFLYWAVWNAFSWKVLSIETSANLSLRLGIFSTYLYNPEKSVDSQNVLLDIERVLPLTKAGVIVDVLQDNDYISKRDSFLSIAPDWCYMSNVTFKNIPEDIVSGGVEKILITEPEA